MHLIMIQFSGELVPMPLICDSLRAAFGGCSLAWRLRAHTSRLRRATFPLGEGLGALLRPML